MSCVHLLLGLPLPLLLSHVPSKNSFSNVLVVLLRRLMWPKYDSFCFLIRFKSCGAFTPSFSTIYCTTRILPAAKTPRFFNINFEKPFCSKASHFPSTHPRTPTSSACVQCHTALRASWLTPFCSSAAVRFRTAGLWTKVF